MDIIVSGIKPTGELHVGNYFGAVANWINFQEAGRCFYMIADLHAMTEPYDPQRLRRNSEQLAIDLMACGIGASGSTLFLQSLVPEHTELCWVLSCVCSYGELTRQTQFKDRAEKAANAPEARFISAGLFSYPVLQCADILAYRGTRVPVGKDQMQHLELAREITRRFNHRFGPFFPEPRALQTDTPKIMSLSDPELKMSKHHGPRHYIGLFEEEGSIRSKVRAAVTDAGMTAGSEAGTSGGVANLFALLRACGKAAEADALWQEHLGGRLMYSRLKEAVGEALVQLVAPMRGRRDELMKEREAVLERLRRMSAEAREVARETVKEVRSLVGLPSR